MGAILHSRVVRVVAYGFNPRPRDGGDVARGDNRRHTNRFNPRPRDGGDPVRDRLVARVVPVSIRAPVMGAIRDDPTG